MTKVELLPKWYGKEERVARSKALKAVATELIATGKMTAKEEEFLKEEAMNFMIIGDTFSRNYVIKQVNQLIDFSKCR